MEEKEEQLTIEQIKTHQFEQQLRDLSYDISRLDKEYQSIKREFETKKSEYKSFLLEHNLNGYRDDKIFTQVRVVDKQSLDEEKTIKYLKSKGLDRFIHTREYIDFDELYMAATKNEINVVDLNEFYTTKKEYRLFINKDFNC